MLMREALIRESSQISLGEENLCSQSHILARPTVKHQGGWGRQLSDIHSGHSVYLTIDNLFQWIPFSKLLYRTQIISFCPL